MPKKGKKKKKVKGAGGGNAKPDELRIMKEAKDRLTNQLDVRAQQYNNLQQEYQRAQDLTNTLERRMRKETGSLRQEIQLKTDQHASVTEELQFELAAEREKIKVYESQLHAAEAVVEENEILRKRVSDLNSILHAQSEEHATMMHNLNSDRFNTRLQLEQAFRKALAEAKQKSQEDALEAMSEDSKKAIQLNRDLTEELKIQSDGIRKMCEHFDMRDEALKAATLKNRLNKSQIQSMTSELTRLARVIQTQKRAMQEKDKNVEAADAAVAAAENRALKLAKQVEAKESVVEEKDTYIKTMQARIHFLSQKLAKTMARRGGGVNRLHTARQKQLLKESSKSNIGANILPFPNYSFAGSRTVSQSFLQSNNSSEEDEEQVPNSLLDPAYIWNADLRKEASQDLTSVPLTVTYPNRDPLRLDGRRSKRTSQVSTQFVP